MNTKRTLITYAVASLVLLIDCVLLNLDGIEYAFMMFLLLLLPVLVVSALMVLFCVLLWKKPVQLSKDDIFFFVAYNTAIPYAVLAAALLVIVLVRWIF
ncbi:MAG: hypothetical protein K2I93_07360 [Oscillospiraceae bacterium]|nr:hypothetical protein [Oscillospiraceae bacterium]